jgi:hypothetical protein
MAEKRKADIVTDKMRARLMQNRDGRIATDQWLDLITEPMVILLLLVAPAAVILGPNFFLFPLSLELPFLILIILLVFGIPILFRARRYARAPIHFDVLYAEDHPRAALIFWKPQTFITEDGKAVRFYKRLAPFMVFRPAHPYLVYYLEDPGGYILLSVAPADHADADQWRPTKFFERRKARQSRSVAR